MKQEASGILPEAFLICFTCSTQKIYLYLIEKNLTVSYDEDRS